ncbi:MAG: 50S ribosomal protein L23 [Planctomycetes bacterium GWA2_40_7]|nr:MAG: 50S ribosomal protein L23 [Planctomycetes bacterium GWA2_40_7]OHB47879.1 MAG: 50S ribosomal protein L23 [Planctomycetes bacterium GWF2_40_8]OHC02178.1 MAG: 50S ribosomal protein L23 [Planctomycetes bacterium RIFCSPLOWO2_12_FULL_40_19]
MDYYQIIKRPLSSEKSVGDRNSTNSYHFEVNKKVNKIQIKETIEKLFDVTVLGVRTLNKVGKKRKYRNKVYKTSGWKKAIVTLKDGDKIDLGY